MFDPQEIKQLKELFTESEAKLMGKIGQSETKMIGKIGDSENRMIGRITEFERKTESKIDQLSNDIASFIENVILPQIAEKADKSDVKRLEFGMERMERKLDWVVEKVTEHDMDIKKLKTKVFPN